MSNIEEISTPLKFQFLLVSGLAFVNPIAPVFPLLQLTPRRALEIRIDDILLLAILAIWTYILFRSYKKISFRLYSGPFWFFSFLVVSLIAMVVSIHSNTYSIGEVARSILFWIKFFQYFLIFCTSIALSYYFKNKYIKLIYILTFTVLLNVMWGMWQILSGQYGYFEGTRGRATMLFDTGPNVFGTYLTIYIPLLFGIILFKEFFERKWLRYGFGILLVISAIVLGSTGSRASFIGTVGGLAVVGVLYINLKNVNIPIGKTILSICLCSLSILVFLTLVNTGPFERLLMWDLRTTIGVRLQGNWLPALRAFGDRPFIGFGFALSGTVWAENYYLRLLSENGIIGFGIFVMLILTLLRETITNIYTNTKFRPIAIGYLGSVVGMLLASIAADKFLVVRLATPFWLIGGLLLGNALNLSNT